MSDFAIKDTPQTPIEAARDLLTPTEIESGAKTLIPDHNAEGFVDPRDGGVRDQIVTDSAVAFTSHNSGAFEVHVKAGALHSVDKSSTASAQIGGQENEASEHIATESSLMPRIKELSIGWKHQSAVGDYVQERMIKAWMSQESVRLGMGEITEKKQDPEALAGDITAAQAVADMETVVSPPSQPPSSSEGESQGEISGTPERPGDAENPDPTSLNQEAADLEGEAVTASNAPADSSNIGSEEVKADDAAASTVTSPEAATGETEENIVAPKVMTETTALMNTAKRQLTGTMGEVGFASGVTQAPEIAAVAPGLPAETELPHVEATTVEQPAGALDTAAPSAPVSLDDFRAQKAAAMANLEKTTVATPGQSESPIREPIKPQVKMSFWQSLLGRFSVPQEEQPELPTPITGQSHQQEELKKAA